MATHRLRALTGTMQVTRGQTPGTVDIPGVAKGWRVVAFEIHPDSFGRSGRSTVDWNWTAWLTDDGTPTTTPSAHSDIIARVVRQARVVGVPSQDVVELRLPRGLWESLCVEADS